jgi:hypothetical protein
MLADAVPTVPGLRVPTPLLDHCRIGPALHVVRPELLAGVPYLQPVQQRPCLDFSAWTLPGPRTSGCRNMFQHLDSWSDRLARSPWKASRFLRNMFRNLFPVYTQRCPCPGQGQQPPDDEIEEPHGRVGCRLGEILDAALSPVPYPGLQRSGSPFGQPPVRCPRTLPDT